MLLNLGRRDDVTEEGASPDGCKCIEALYTGILPSCSRLASDKSGNDCWAAERFHPSPRQMENRNDMRVTGIHANFTAEPLENMRANDVCPRCQPGKFCERKAFTARKIWKRFHIASQE